MRRTRERSVETGPVNRKGRRTARWIGRALVLLIAASGVVAHTPLTPADEAHAIEAAAQETNVVKAPQVFSILGRTDRMIAADGELRVDLVLKVPHGYVNEKTGELQQVDGAYLRVGYESRPDSSSATPIDKSLDYLNTFNAAGADLWARNQGYSYTVHKVITAGVNDYLVMSLEGNMAPPQSGVNNVLGGLPTEGFLYFSYEQTSSPNPGTSVSWMKNSLTKYSVPYHIYAFPGSTAVVTGPIAQTQRGDLYKLWSGGQASWGQVLDFGLNSKAPGVYPANSVAADIMNYAFDNPNRGPAGSVSNSFWYAWVKEDGTLATTINTKPIHVTGFRPHGGGSDFNGTQKEELVKNADTGPGTVTMARTAESAAQGLTPLVSAEGDIDFRGAGGTGYYRLLVWPEAVNPPALNGDILGTVITYTKDDLFTGNVPTERALDQAFTIGTAFYKYDIPRPGIPVIKVPVDGSVTTENKVVEISGTGTPGHSISLKFMAGGPITDTNDPKLETILDGDRSCAEQACEVIVRPDRTWSFTYTPKTPLEDGQYSVVATQTEQTTAFNTTSNPSNPNKVTDPTAWGVTFTVDHNPPAAPVLDCPTDAFSELRPTIGGSGIEAGAKVYVSLDGERVGEAKVTGTNWSYTFEKDLAPGSHDVSVTQVDSAGNESEASTPACKVVIAIDVPIVGKDTVLDVKYPAPRLPGAAPDNWEVFVKNGDTEQVISGGAEVALERDVTYTLGQRVRERPAAETTAALYAQRGNAVCVDAAGVPLPETLFNPKTNELKFAGSDVVETPVTCTFENQASHASLVTKRLGGQTLPAEAGWKLSGTPVGAGGARALADGTAFVLDDQASSAVAHPGGYRLEAETPAGLSQIGIERLNLADDACAPAAPDATQAPERCWVQADQASAPLAQGTHEVFRVVAAAPGDMPSLPLTGGLGSWLFTLGGLGALLLAGTAYVRKKLAQLVANRASV